MTKMMNTAAITLGIAVFCGICPTKAYAGCGDLPIRAIATGTQPSIFTTIVGPLASASHGESGIVGMWKVTFTSKGNQSHNPPIPDGAVIDFGYSQWHSDGTEFLNSGGRSPASQNYCLGVWKMTGGKTYKLNHFALAYDPISGILVANVNIREEVTLDQGGDSYAGTFTIDVFSLNNDLLDHVEGAITGQRITVD